MRYAIQIAVMLGDLVVFAMAGIVLYHMRDLFALVICGIAIKVWNSHGGWEAWRPSVIRQFMKNAKEIGL